MTPSRTPCRALLLHRRPEIVAELRGAVAGHGCRVECLSGGRASLRRALREGFDLVVVDPGAPGVRLDDVCRELRSGGDDAVLVLAVRLSPGDSDAVFERAQVLARLTASLGKAHTVASAQPSITFGDVHVDFESGRALRGSQTALLTVKEVELLRYLAGRRGDPISREELLTSVWRYHPNVASRTIDVHISSLRRKLESNPRRPRHLQTVRGVGYRFSA